MTSPSESTASGSSASGSSASTVTRRPIRGALYGIVLGIGLALMVVGRKIVTLDSIVPVVLIVLGVAIGVAWSMFAPAKTKGSPTPS